MTRFAVDNDSIVVPASRRKGLLLLVASGVFVAISLFLVIDGHADFIGWFSLGFFGLCLVVSIVLLLPGSTRLTVDKDGIEWTNMFRRTHIRWSDVQSFYVGTIRTGLASTTMIGVNYSASYQGQQAGRRAALALTGMEGAIPNHFQVSAEELCELLNNAKRRWSHVA